MKRTLRKTIVYPHPIDRVWRALTHRDALAQWLMPNDFEPVVGHQFQFRTDPAPGFDGVVHCRVLDLDEPRLLRISWRGGPVDTVVTWRLEHAGDGRTRLEFEHAGFDGLRAILVSFILGSGWPRMYEKFLPEVLEQLARGALDPGASLRCRAQGSASPVKANLIARLARVLPDRMGRARRTTAVKPTDRPSERKTP